MKNTHAVAINCIDGRVQIPVIEWMKENYLVDYVDLITEPGPNYILYENEPVELVRSMRKRVALSTEKHNSKILAVSGHADCASNKSSNETQLIQIEVAKGVIKAWEFDLKIIGLWVDDSFKVTEV